MHSPERDHVRRVVGVSVIARDISEYKRVEVLRADEELHSTVVFGSSTSTSDEDRTRAYAANVAGFIVKFEAGLGFLETLRLLEHYWRIVELPT